MRYSAAQLTATDRLATGGETPGGPDPRAAVVTGLTTLAWYAVPDVVTPRWARALAKTAVAVGGSLGMLVTADGRALRAGLRELRAANADGSRDEQGEDVAAGAPSDDRAVDDENGPVLGADDAEPEPGVNPVLAGAAVVGVTAAAVLVAVGGEKWAYRRGERWRESGLAWPHTRVGLVLGVLAAGVTLLEPPRAVPLDQRP
ncbi:hypothetical protein LEP48_01760 [Isoptericola sp. NEAU-Y5]|uniref:Peptidase S9 n=1 Tax=Isoptericola luteus TaxID=2879484 RepID=A0ABS7ZC90_9MICO|nr:hypothetical protein [Isoptericola sp. NEAU-Y5]MCA5892077.1 hypothetical protein [Isoptericola sp. NEAU-Y5]